jgi:hypothetical protein
VTVAKNTEAIERLRRDTDEAVARLQLLHLDVPDTLGKALSYVYRRVGYVQKGRSKGLNYSYAGEAALIAAIRPWMAEAGLVGPYPVEVTASVVAHTPTRGGSNQTRHEVIVTYELMHGPTGERLRLQVPGLGIDSGDKGTAKAMTMAYKYILRQLWCVETGDDPDETPSAAQESAAVALPTDPATAEPDAEWNADKVRFTAKLRELGLTYDAVKTWSLGAGNGKPSTWARAGRGRFIRDLLSDKIPDLYQTEPGAAG